MDLIKEGYLEKLREWDDINGYKEEIIDYFLQLKRINLYSQELAQFCIWIYSLRRLAFKNRRFSSYIRL